MPRFLGRSPYMVTLQNTAIYSATLQSEGENFGLQNMLLVGTRYIASENAELLSLWVVGTPYQVINAAI